MDTWRCPTCLAVLRETGAKRCPQCRSRLRKRRSQPIVLGDSSRLDRQAALVVDRQNQRKAEHVFVVDPVVEAVVVAPEQESVEPKVEVEPVPSFLELALAEQPAPPRPADTDDLDAAIEGDDVNSIVDAPHQQARVERRAFPDVQLFDPAPPEPEATTGPLRLVAPASSSRRRWNIEFKNDRADDDV